MRHTAAGAPGTIQSLRRGLRVLEALADQGGRLTLTEIARRLKLHSSTAHHLIKTLQDEGYIVQDEDTREYRIGSRIFEVAAVAWSENEVAKLGEAVVTGLMLKTGHSAHLAVLDMRNVVVIRKVDAEGPWRLSERAGEMRPAASTALGKVMVAFKGPELAKRYIVRMPFKALTANTITNPREFEAELDRIRAQGYAVDNEEYAIGMRCVAAPVFNFSGKGVAAMGISGPSWSLTLEQVEILQPVVREFAHRLSRILGYTPELARRPSAEPEATPRRRAARKTRRWSS
jgi:DNA-binding IclR family transcriptional regulator